VPRVLSLTRFRRNNAQSGSPESSIPACLPVVFSPHGRCCLDVMQNKESTYLQQAPGKTKILVPVTLVGSKKQGSDGWVERTRRFSASTCPKRYGSSRSIGIKLVQVCIFLQVVAVCVRARFLAQACNPKATRCPRRHGSNPSTPSAPWHRSLVLHGRPPSRRDGHLAHLTSCVCCSPAATHRHPPPTTTRPPLHHLPSLPASDPTASKSRTLRQQFPAHYLLPTLRKDWRAHCRHYLEQQRRLARPWPPACRSSLPPRMRRCGASRRSTRR